jgi:hypothetical protein
VFDPYVFEHDVLYFVSDNWLWIIIAMGIIKLLFLRDNDKK